MAKDNKSGAPKLDLGIQAILERANGDTGKDRTQVDLEVAPTAIYTLSDDDGDFSEEFATLAQSKQWGILVSRAEAALSDAPDLQARLWWVRGHLGALSLPVSLLAAPFESVCRQIAQDPESIQAYQPLLREIASIMRERLRGVGDRRQEHAVMLAVQKLGLLDPLADKQRPAWGERPAASPRFELGADRSSAPTGQVAKAAETTTAVVERRQGLARLWPAVVLGVALLVVLVALVTGKMMMGHEGALAVQVASEGLVSGDSAERSLAPPSVEPRSNLSNLEAVFYSLSGSEVTPGGQPTKGGASIEKERRPAAQAQTSGSEERQGAPKQQETPRSGGSATSREVVNTEGPIEGAEFRKGLEARNPRAPRLPEALPDSKPAQPQGGAYPEVGGVVLGEVKSVIVATSVLDKPSYQARILSRLHEGDKVSVEARVGRWVRIRSRRGKTGYVFAQDVGEPEDFIASEATP